MSSDRIRPLAVCVCRHGERVLVEHGHDRVTGRAFYRAIGGGIEFGERAADAVRREWREELGVDLAEPRLAGVLENRFTYEGRPGHEIVFVFTARPPAALLEAGESREVAGEDGGPEGAIWVALAELESGPTPLYPPGILGLVRDRAEAASG